MRRFMLSMIVAFAAGAWPSNARAQFIGNLVLLPKNCQSTGICTLGRDFAYKDPSGVGWQASKGDKTDGASIPSWAQPFVGAPFEKAYIKAAVLHDHYCDRHVRSWYQTHRMFYNALRSSGVSVARANTLYGAVMLGGPKWLTIITGHRCSFAETCIFSKSVTTRTEITVREPLYDTPEFKVQMAALEKTIDADASHEMSPDEIDAIVFRLRPDDDYLKNVDGVRFQEITAAGTMTVK